MKLLVYWGYNLAWKFLRALPEGSAYKLGSLLADFIYQKNGPSAKRMRANYQRFHPELSSPELEELLAKGMRSYLRYWVDTFRFPGWNRERILSTVTIENEEFLREPMAAGTGLIVALPHAGNWDHAGAFFCATGAPLVTVAEHLDPEKLFRKFLAFRQAMGMEVLDFDSRVIATLAQRARAGRLIALVADRDLSQSGINVDFAGFPSRMPAGPALLSIQTGAPLITAYVQYSDVGIHIIFEPTIEIPREGTTTEKAAVMTQAMANRFAKNIKAKTEDWHMLQRIWIDGDFKERR
jgi:KDO2-lipid IV(A) lauroyltransferase